ncbi:hypothetical protein MZO42_18795 [Sphingomonas psychrotolerans]|uniref:Porin domain-containing protein n=1 Tax=Sphingomonas psychrotolerans TaxID=1327635 RepID=A0ABU3NBA1_9SPHN|nr:hypothetical protein [Sphingomonas psychrotolerans]MDT8760756.1 hypothetical protein [Sphingomonas psychrotolerans]
MKMRLARLATIMGLGAICAAGALVAPALQAQENGRLDRGYAKRPATALRSGIGTFTPAAADPKLAAILARSGLPEAGFRFTPSESRRGGRAVTVAVRARSTRTAAIANRSDVIAATPVSLAPIAYNLGVSVGWKRFAVAGDVTRVELVTQPGSTERANVGVSYSGNRVTGRVQAAAERPLANTPVLIGDKPSYSIDVGGSYSLTRNLDVTAGVRYKSEQDRLPKMTDNRRDSQAVYVGTAFRF